MSIPIGALIQISIAMGDVATKFIGIEDQDITGVDECLLATATGAFTGGFVATGMPAFMAAQVRSDIARDIDKIAETKQRAQSAKAAATTIRVLDNRTEKLRLGAASTEMVLWAITVVEYLELLLGFGPPCEGEGLKAGSEQFIPFSRLLMSALPDDSWLGSAAQAYAGQNTALRNPAQALARLDLTLTDTVTDQAEKVIRGRLAYEIVKGLLLAAHVALMAALLSPNCADLVLAHIWAVHIAGLGIATAWIILFTLVCMSADNRDKAVAIGRGYASIAPSATTTCGSIQARVGSGR